MKKKNKWKQNNYTRFLSSKKKILTDYKCSASVTIIAVVECFTENANWFKFVLTIYTISICVCFGGGYFASSFSMIFFSSYFGSRSQLVRLSWIEYVMVQYIVIVVFHLHAISLSLSCCDYCNRLHKCNILYEMNKNKRKRRITTHQFYLSWATSNICIYFSHFICSLSSNLTNDA